MPNLWIVDRDPAAQTALARLAAAPESAVRGGPADPRFDTAPAPDVVLLGLEGDLEAELQFAHRHASRIPGAHWILLTDAGGIARSSALFDSLDAEIHVYPPDAAWLRERIRSAAFRGAGLPLPLSQRPSRDALSERFNRWFADLELPELMRALDPRLAGVPLLILGEPGSGRGLLARYVHAFGGGASGVLAHVPCTSAADGDRILARLAAASRLERGRAGCTVVLEELGALDAATQLELRRWIEFGPPEGVLRSNRVRWIGTASGGGATLEPTLRQALSGLCIRIPALRDRPGLVARFANEAARSWCSARGERPRRLGEDALVVLEEYPWPGNLCELESVVEQTLAAGAADPVRSDDLQHEGFAFAPLEAAEIGALIPAGPEPEEPEVDLVLSESDLVTPPLGDVQDDREEGAREAESGGAKLGDPREDTGKTPEEARPDLRRLAGAVAHEVRNPLTAIRTFTELLPSRWNDAEFRSRFAALVGDGVVRIRDVVEQLEQLAALSEPARESVDLSALLAELLESRRERIRERRLLVLQELESEQPCALGDPAQLRFALEALLDRCLELVPERGDVYLASKHHAEGQCLRVLLRFQGAERTGSTGRGLSPAENALGLIVADSVVSAAGGTLTLDTRESGETVIVLDLPA